MGKGDGKGKGKGMDDCDDFDPVTAIVRLPGLDRCAPPLICNCRISQLGTTGPMPCEQLFMMWRWRRDQRLPVAVTREPFVFSRPKPHSREMECR